MIILRIGVKERILPSYLVTLSSLQSLVASLLPAVRVGSMEPKSALTFMHAYRAKMHTLHFCSSRIR